MQKAINALHKWAALWQLSISVEKCSVLSIGKQIVFPSLYIAENVLFFNTLCRNLGILVQSDLKPSVHMKLLVKHKKEQIV